jgi:ankyrin repeat protein
MFSIPYISDYQKCRNEEGKMKRLILAVVCLIPVIFISGCGQQKIKQFSARDVSEFESAVQDGDADIVDNLLTEKPGLANVRDQNGKTPLDIAEAKGQSDMIEVIKKHGGKE